MPAPSSSGLLSRLKRHGLTGSVPTPDTLPPSIPSPHRHSFQEPPDQMQHQQRQRSPSVKQPQFMPSQNIDEMGEILLLTQKLHIQKEELQRELAAVRAERDESSEICAAQAVALDQLKQESAAVCDASVVQRKAITMAQEGIDRLKKTVRLYQTTIHKLEDKGRLVLQQIRDLTRKMEAKSTECKMLAEEKDRIGKEAEELRKSHQETRDAMTSHIQSLADQKASLLEDISSIKEQLGNADKSHATAKQEFEAAMKTRVAEMEQLKTRIAELELEMQTRATAQALDKVKMDAYCTTLETNLGCAKDTAQEIQQQLLARETKCRELQESIKSLKDALVDAQKAAREALERVLQVESDKAMALASAKIEIDRLTAEMAQCIASAEQERKRSLDGMAGLEAAKDQLTGDLEQAKRECAELQISINRMMDEMANMESSAGNAMAMLKDQHAQVDAVHQAEISTLQQALADALHFHREAEAKAAAVEKEMELLQHSMRDNAAKADAAEAERDVAFKDKASMQETVDRNERRLQEELQQERDRCRTIVEKSTHRMEELATHIRKLERERNETHEQRTRDIEYKTAQWNSIAKHKEMEYQNALRQKDNQIASLKADVSRLNALANVPSLAQIEASKSMETADDMLRELNLDALLGDAGHSTESHQDATHQHPQQQAAPKVQTQEPKAVAKDAGSRSGRARKQVPPAAETAPESATKQASTPAPAAPSRKGSAANAAKRASPDHDAAHDRSDEQQQQPSGRSGRKRLRTAFDPHKTSGSTSAEASAAAPTKGAGRTVQPSSLEIVRETTTTVQRVYESRTHGKPGTAAVTAAQSLTPTPANKPTRPSPSGSASQSTSVNASKPAKPTTTAKQGTAKGRSAPLARRQLSTEAVHLPKKQQRPKVQAAADNDEWCDGGSGDSSDLFGNAWANGSTRLA
ncbi:hypothetical protein BC831DRAFT_461722 [Entophlyctis helioformis]|nr:hypothetical protein BC831DRAFT_461722 [Entophlyctis helioformis]